jgi:hypothetical protein
MTQSATLFGPEGDRFIEMIEQLELPAIKVRYTFTANDDFKDVLSKRDFARVNRIFWTEMLERTHLAAVTAILRNHQWIAGIKLAIAGKNLLTFAAGFRGLIESAADSATALKDVPTTIARDHSKILRAVSGQFAEALLNVTQLEDESLVIRLYAIWHTPVLVPYGCGLGP